MSSNLSISFNFDICPEYRTPLIRIERYYSPIVKPLQHLWCPFDLHDLCHGHIAQKGVLANLLGETNLRCMSDVLRLILC